uniref:Phospholipid-transporting ATPase n=1 Tax=Schistocephalus solidus TaxID=70667 RepID=A0A0X3PIY4_SCHSO
MESIIGQMKPFLPRAGFPDGTLHAIILSTLASLPYKTCSRPLVRTKIPSQLRSRKRAAMWPPHPTPRVTPIKIVSAVHGAISYPITVHWLHKVVYQKKGARKSSHSPTALPSLSCFPSSSDRTLRAEASDLEPEQCQRIQDFFLCLAICNTVVVSVNKNVPAPLAPAPRVHRFHIRRNRLGSKGQLAPEDGLPTRSYHFHLSRSSKALSNSKFKQISASLGNLLPRGKRSSRRVANYSSPDDPAGANARENEVTARDVDGTCVQVDHQEPVIFTLSNIGDTEGCPGSATVVESAVDRASRSTRIIEGYSNSHFQARATAGYNRLANGRPLSVVAESSQASQATDSVRQGCIIGGIPHLGHSATAISSAPTRVTPLTDRGMRGNVIDRPSSTTPDDSTEIESSGGSLFSVSGTGLSSVRNPHAVPHLKLSPASSSHRFEHKTSPLSSEEVRTAAYDASRSVDSLDALKSARTDISLAGSNGSLNAGAKSVCPISEATLLNGYESESPDEIALTRTACIYGCKLLQRGLDFVVLWLPGEGMIRVQVLHVLPFDSTRKCMSIIVRHPATNEVVLFTKGADSVILAKLAPAKDNALYEKTKNYLTAYSHAGLRTLVLAKRVISENDFMTWSAAYMEAETSYTDAEERKGQLTREIENNFELLGVTGIEDRLQEGVPETLSDLRRAGMKVWVLTGDKPETATSIAYAAKLFTEEQRLLSITATNAEEAEAEIKRQIADLLSGALSEELSFAGRINMNGQYLQTAVSVNKEDGLNESQPSEYLDTNFSVVSLLNNEVPVNIPQNLGMVVDGHTLNFLLEPNVWPLFMSLAQLCSSVVCCRVSPHQKACVVSAVKSELGVQTLAIGDGANDVNMIQCADVGIGISGQEGMQAVMASDFAISRFRFLKRLLLVHGHWCYEKLARMTLYMFYKDAVSQA